MTTTLIISLILSFLVLLMKQSGRNIKFRLLSLIICSVICAVFLLFTDLGWWNIIVLPVVTFVGVFISLLISPLTAKEAYKSSGGMIKDYFNTLPNGKPIGTIKVFGFKETNERLLQKVLYGLTSSEQEVQKIMKNLYSEIFYPSSKTQKEEIISHVKNSIDDVMYESAYLTNMLRKNPNIYAYVFNIFLCILQINEEATDNINKQREESELDN